MRMVKELLMQMRNVYRKVEMDAKNILEGKGEVFFNRDGQSSSQ